MKKKHSIIFTLLVSLVLVSCELVAPSSNTSSMVSDSTPITSEVPSSEDPSSIVESSSEVDNEAVANEILDLVTEGIDEGMVVSGDLELKTVVDSYEATITWESGNTDILTNTGNLLLQVL